MQLPSTLDSDTETDDGDVPLFLPSQAAKAASGIDLETLLALETAESGLEGSTVQGHGRYSTSSPLFKDPRPHAHDTGAAQQPDQRQNSANSQAAAGPPDFVAPDISTASGSLGGITRQVRNTFSGTVDPLPHGSTSVAPALPSSKTAVTEHSSTSESSNNSRGADYTVTAAPVSPAAGPAAAEPANTPGSPTREAAGAAAQSAQTVLGGTGLLDDLDLDALLQRLATRGAGISTAPAPVHLIADSRFINSPPLSPAAATEEHSPAAYQPRWAKRPLAGMAAGHLAATGSQSGSLTRPQAGNISTSGTSSGTDSPSRATRVWTDPRPMVTIDLRDDKHQQDPAQPDAARRPAAFGRWGVQWGSSSATAAEGAGLQAAAVARTASRTPATTTTTDISDWWDPSNGATDDTESDDSEDEWMHFRQQHHKHTRGR